jgi:hypothetical protein
MFYVMPYNMTYVYYLNYDLCEMVQKITKPCNRANGPKGKKKTYKPIPHGLNCKKTLSLLFPQVPPLPCS